jgi:glycine cleavage system H protein
MSEHYLPSHEWARVEGGLVVCGLSRFAAGEVGDVIHVALPQVGQKVSRGQGAAEIESVKSVNDYYSPVDGEVVEINSAMAERPELVNQEPLAGGWFFKVKPSAANPVAGLLDGAAYEAQLRA